MQHSRQQRTRRRVIITTAIIIVVGAFGGWWYFGSSDGTPLPEANASPNVVDEAAVVQAAIDTEEKFKWEHQIEQPPTETVATEDEVLLPEGGPVASSTSVQVKAPPAALTEKPGEQKPISGNTTLEAAQRQYAAGKALEARHALNTLLKQSLPPLEQAEVRRLLTKIADETLYSRRCLPGDRYVDTYNVQPGDVLQNIGREYKVPPEILMRINGIQDATKLRADAKIKVLHGPFHVKIHKSQFRLDVYLQDLYVHSFRVALGADQGTPEGVWKVKERLANPTYYPPPSAEAKRIIPAGDPENPLGEHWIGLEGIEGDAQGRYGYGIHGTIEPESIGQAVSLGCVRLLNEDAATLYSLLLPGQSTVTTLP